MIDKEVNKELNIKAIDVLRTALGTMVMFPTEVTNPDTFQKEVRGSVQRPILEGEIRKETESKLRELINSL